MRFLLVLIIICALVIVAVVGYNLRQEKFSVHEIIKITFDPKQEPHLVFQLAKPINGLIISKLTVALWQFAPTASVNQKENNLIEALQKFPFRPNTPLSSGATVDLSSNTLPASRKDFPNKKITITGKGVMRFYLKNK